MADTRRYPPNRALTWERLQRGWSHDELATQIKASMDSAGDGNTGLTGNTVRRWEIGERWPEPRFRKHLVLVFDKPASDLGLLTPEETALCPANELILDLARRVQSMPESAFSGVSRQAFLRGLLGISATSALGAVGLSADGAEALANTLTRQSSTDPRAIDAYTDIMTRHRTLYWSSPARPLFESALSHTQLGTQLMCSVTGDANRTRLAGALAESALLSARLAFFDLRQSAVAQRALDTALAATRYADNHDLAAAVLAHMSFIPGFSGDDQLATELLESAQKHARYEAGPLLRSWLQCVAAEITARNKDTSASLRHVRQAGDSLNTAGTDPEWLDFYDTSRLAGFTGYSLLIAGRHTEATTSLEEALTQLDDKADKQRAVLLADLAMASAPDDAERAAALANDAISALERDWYGAAYERLAHVREALTGTTYAAELTERSRELPAWT